MGASLRAAKVASELEVSATWQVLGGLLAGVVAIAAPRADAIEILDGTKLRESGFDIIYNARDLDKSQVRVGGTASGGIQRPRLVAKYLMIWSPDGRGGVCAGSAAGMGPASSNLRHRRHRASCVQPAYCNAAPYKAAARS